MLHPEDRTMDNPPRSWIRPSQRKIYLVNLEEFLVDVPWNSDVVERFTGRT